MLCCVGTFYIYVFDTYTLYSICTVYYSRYSVFTFINKPQHPLTQLISLRVKNFKFHEHGMPDQME